MDTQNSRILMSGASGLIGSALKAEAQRQGRETVRLVRERQFATKSAIYWNPASALDSVHLVDLEGFGAAIHLSGATVAHRWTKAYKEKIVNSRVRSTQALSQMLGRLRQKPSVLICASAVGIYGDRGDEMLTEESAAGSGFLAETCVAWEAAAEPARQAGIRVVHARLGVVLSREGGALGKMLTPFRFGLGGPMGSGRQWMSWISLRDVVRAIFYLLQQQEMKGAFNLTAPEPVRNRDFTRALGAVLKKPAFLPVPRLGLRAAFGEMADEALLASQRAVPRRLEEAGFSFEDREIGAALAALLR